MGAVVVAGSLNADLVLRVPRLPAPGETVSATSLDWHAGGKGANQAAAAALAGATTRFVGCVGDDEHGPRLVATLRSFGVDVQVRTVPGPSGQAIVTVDAAGENAIVVVAGANAALAAPDVEHLGLGAGDVAVAPLESPPQVVAAFLRAARPAVRVLNPTPVEHCDAALLAEADVIVVNEAEQEALGVAGPSVVVTRGARGVTVGDHAIAGIPAKVVDTTGAGDCFVGTLAARLAAGADLHTAAERANVAAARSVGRAGAMESYR